MEVESTATVNQLREMCSNNSELGADFVDKAKLEFQRLKRDAEKTLGKSPKRKMSKDVEEVVTVVKEGSSASMPDNMDGTRRLHEPMLSSETDEEDEDESDSGSMWDHEEAAVEDVERTGSKKSAVSRSAVHFEREDKEVNGKRTKKAEARKGKEAVSRSRRGSRDRTYWNRREDDYEMDEGSHRRHRSPGSFAGQYTARKDGWNSQQERYNLQNGSGGSQGRDDNGWAPRSQGGLGGAGWQQGWQYVPPAAPFNGSMNQMMQQPPYQGQDGQLQYDMMPGQQQQQQMGNWQLNNGGQSWNSQLGQQLGGRQQSPQWVQQPSQMQQQSMVQPQQAGYQQHYNWPQQHNRATRSQALNYGIDATITNDVLAGRKVPCFKLIKGYKSLGGNLYYSQGGKITVKDSDDIILSKRALTVEMLVLALLKYKEIVSNFPERVADIDRHISHVLDIKIKYKGWAYYLYHDMVWESFFQPGVVTWGGNWIAADPSALSAAANRFAKCDKCAHCGTWEHASEVCPSRDVDSTIGGPPVPPSPPAVAGRGQGGRTVNKAAKDFCVEWNAPQGCSRVRECQWVHACYICKSDGHGASICGTRSQHRPVVPPFAPPPVDLRDY